MTTHIIAALIGGVIGSGVTLIVMCCCIISKGGQRQCYLESCNFCWRFH